MPTIKEILQTMDYGPAPESTKEAQAWLDQHGRRFGLFIDNEWTEAQDTFATTNPADGVELAQVTQATNDDVERAARPQHGQGDGHGEKRGIKDGPEARATEGGFHAQQHF